MYMYMYKKYVYIYIYIYACMAYLLPCLAISLSAAWTLCCMVAHKSLGLGLCLICEGFVFYSRPKPQEGTIARAI